MKFFAVASAILLVAPGFVLTGNGTDRLNIGLRIAYFGKVSNCAECILIEFSAEQDERSAYFVKPENDCVLELDDFRGARAAMKDRQTVLTFGLTEEARSQLGECLGVGDDASTLLVFSNGRIVGISLHHAEFSELSVLGGGSVRALADRLGIPIDQAGLKRM